MPAPTALFTGAIDARGRLSLDRPVDYGRQLMALANSRVELIVRKRRARRSNQANRRYFALLQIAAPQLGYDDVEELHDGLAFKFLGVPPDERTGLARRRHTPKCDTAEFANYTDACERYLRIDLGLDLSGWDDAEDQIARAS